jgi:hypothetical protein
MQFVFGNLATERVAMYPQNFRRTALISLDAFQDAFDEFLLELRDSLFQKDAAFDHQSNQRFQFIFQIRSLQDRCRNFPGAFDPSLRLLSHHPLSNRLPNAAFLALGVGQMVSFDPAVKN